MSAALFFITGLLLTVLVIPLLKKISFNIGYLDSPEGDPLKIHALPIPDSGGMAIFGVFGLLLLFLSLAGDVDVDGLQLAVLLLTAAMAFSFGVWGDLKTVHPAVRLGGGIIAGMILILFGHRIQAPFMISLPLTLFYVVGAINAINMEDGLDGLAGGMALLSFVGFAILSALKAQTIGLMISSILIGVLIGFLYYNFNPSSIFMGDNGSYFLGFILAYLAVSYTTLDHWCTFLAPILIIGVPVLDAAYAILRRLKKGVSPFTGDRSHFYDQLIKKGLSVRQTVLLCWAIQVAFVVCGVLIFMIGD